MINNLAQVESTLFYKKIKDTGCKIIDSKPKEDESLDELGQRFENQISEWMKNNPDGDIIASAGIGPDAHTTGIMPYPEDPEFFQKAFDNTEHLAVGYDAKGKNQYSLRVTVTFPLIRKISFVVIYACGDSKKEALSKLFAQEGRLNESPCRIWRELDNVELFTDQEIHAQ
jgi:6-phosphogluconolactonase/glucosamine-6-phosphate isomerase/deaminase